MRNIQWRKYDDCNDDFLDGVPTSSCSCVECHTDVVLVTSQDHVTMVVEQLVLFKFSNLFLYSCAVLQAFLLMNS